MSLVGTIGMVSFGAVIGHVGPRLPALFLTRGRGFNVHFSPHPEPVRLSPHLTQRILHLRSFYWLSFVLAGVVLAFGAVSLRWGSATFGFGLWLSSSWLILSRLQQVLAGRPAPWTYDMAVSLQNIMDQSRTDAACCHHPDPAWGLQAILCETCGAVLSREPRPDLGRPRKDGRIRGFLRLLITDGYPFAEPLPSSTSDEE